jgi:hypothetical protein
MNGIAVVCPIDGRVELTPERVTLYLFDDPYGKPYYEFVCSKCSQAYQRDANSAIVALLFPMVEHVLSHVPLELVESNPQGPAITEDEITDFILEMSRQERERAPRTV